MSSEVVRRHCKAVITVAAEKQFEQKLKKWLESEGIYPLGTPRNKMTVEPCGYWLKRWGGGKFTQNGLPDMQIVVKGISIESELKAPNGRPSELQKFMINQINESGGIGMILYPKDFETFKELVLKLKRSNNNA
jgi:hypothetical protein